MRATEITALSAATFAVALMVVALTTNWAMEADAPETKYGPFDTESTGGGFFGGLDFAYSSQAFDDADGIAMVRAAAPMLLIGLGLGVLAAVGWENQILAKTGREVAAGAGGLGAIIWLTGLILLAMGLKDLVVEDGVDGAYRLITGFWMAILATVALLAATIVSVVDIARDNGFKLELADNEGTFD